MPPLEAISGKGELRESSSTDSRRKIESIKEQFAEHARITFHSLKAASAEETQQLAAWVSSLETNAEELNKSDWFIPWSKNAIKSAQDLYRTFEENVGRAEAKHLISYKSKNDWIQRFKDERINYKQKEYWVKHQLPTYINNWEKIAEERKKLVADKRFSDLLQYNPAFADIKDEEKFLALHYDKKKGLLAAARSTLYAAGKIQLDLHGTAESKLHRASTSGILADSKVGIWLERIFKSNSSPEKIQAFVNGTGPTSLEGLMRKWEEVSNRFDNIEKKFKERWDGSGIRGFQPLSRTQFLSLHYTQRLRYVEQAEDRLDEANDVENEAPILLKLRHAMDIKDWQEAGDIIMEAKMSRLSERDFKRLKSMESYVNQFRGKKGNEDKIESVTEARRRMDQIVEEIGQHHSEVQPMVLRLLQSPHANRNIHQFRWITYNNDWCETHGYLNYERAKQGASKENEELTRERALAGEDIGRHDVISHTTSSSQQFIRKEEHANHKASYRHVNVSSGGATQETAEWLEREQNEKVLYWTTFCANENGEPKSHNWHKDLFMQLTELRSLTRTMHGAGFMYGGQGKPPISMN